MSKAKLPGRPRKTPKTAETPEPSRQGQRARKSVSNNAKRGFQTVKARLLNAVTKRGVNGGGPLATTEQAKEIARIEREFEALDLKRKGLTWRQIGDRLGVSHTQARDYVFCALSEVYAQKLDMALLVRDASTERLEEVQRVMTPLLHGQVPGKTVVTGRGKARRLLTVPADPLAVAALQTKAASQIRHTNESLRRLYGVDAPAKVALTDPTGERPYQEMSEDDLEREIAARMSTLGIGPAIDVTTVGSNGNGTGHGRDGD